MRTGTSSDEIFELSGPLHLIDAIDWTSPDHQRCIAACLVQAVYLMQSKNKALAPRWWEFCGFELHKQLIDTADSSIFGAIFRCVNSVTICGRPSYVIAFRGTIPNGVEALQDFALDINIICNNLHKRSRFKIAMKAVETLVADEQDSVIWLAGHSLGSALALLVGKEMAITGILLKTFLFNPPFVPPRFTGGQLKAVVGLSAGWNVAMFGIYLKTFMSCALTTITPATSVQAATALFAAQSATMNAAFLSTFLLNPLVIGIPVSIIVLLSRVIKGELGAKRLRAAEARFLALAAWVPRLFVHPSDIICSKYIEYFEYRKELEQNGAGEVERSAIKELVFAQFLRDRKLREDGPMHAIPSANLTISSIQTQNSGPHSLMQWWSPDLLYETDVYTM